MSDSRSHVSGDIALGGNVRATRTSWRGAIGFGLAILVTVLAVHVEGQEPFSLGTDRMLEPLAVQDNTTADFVPPTVFQAAGPDAASIQSAVDAFRHALGDQVNGNVAQEFKEGHREINWDGAPPTDATTPAANPFNTFLNTRGAQFTTPGIGLVQGPASGGPQGGLATLFNNPSYATAFRAFSNARLFTPVGSNITDTAFFGAGSGGSRRAAVTGFGVVFTDTDQPDGSGPANKHGNRAASTLVQYFGADGRLLFSSFAPASPGNGGFSFLGIKFNDPRISSVRIIAGNVAPGPDDDDANDIVMMDDFIYGEPQSLSQP